MKKINLLLIKNIILTLWIVFQIISQIIVVLDKIQRRFILKKWQKLITIIKIIIKLDNIKKLNKNKMFNKIKNLRFKKKLYKIKNLKLSTRLVNSTKEIIASQVNIILLRKKILINLLIIIVRVKIIKIKIL